MPCSRRQGIPRVARAGFGLVPRYKSYSPSCSGRVRVGAAQRWGELGLKKTKLRKTHGFQMQTRAFLDLHWKGLFFALKMANVLQGIFKLVWRGLKQHHGSFRIWPDEGVTLVGCSVFYRVFSNWPGEGFGGLKQNQVFVWENTYNMQKKWYQATSGKCFWTRKHV